MFNECKTLQEAKKLYHELQMINHPDRGGDTEKCKEINLAFEAFISTFYTTTASANMEFENRTRPDFNFDFTRVDTVKFADILNKIIHFNVSIEIIGFWIYCFDSYNVKEELKTLGFWFSKKHKAWVFSGRAKIAIKSRYTTDDIRGMHGSETVKSFEEQLQLA